MFSGKSFRAIGLLVCAAGALASLEAASAQVGARAGGTAGQLPSTSSGSRFQLPGDTGAAAGIGGGAAAGTGGYGSGAAAVDRIPPTTPRPGSSAAGSTSSSSLGSPSPVVPRTSSGGAAAFGGGASAGAGSPFGSGSSTIPSTSAPGSAIPNTSAAGSSRNPLPFDAPPSRDDTSAEPLGDNGPAIGSRSGETVSVDGVQTKGYALIGPAAHHYIFGNLAIADYMWQGQRRIVSLTEETNLPKADANFMYYREIQEGNRWAISTKAGPDRRYSIYFQPQDQAQGKWRRLQRAELQPSRTSGMQMWQDTAFAQ